MAGKVIICEKPSLAREVAKVLGVINNANPVPQKQCIKVGGDYVTWFAGHVFRQAMPREYYDGKWARYSLTSLPVVVENGDWKMEEDPNKKDLIRAVRKLASQASEIYNCGDADREGQLLIDEALVAWGIDPYAPNVKRIWASDLSEKLLRKAIEGAFANGEKRSLYEAGLARSRADWEHGMTFSRAFQMFVKMGGADQKISVGRVQTPSLYLIVRRDLERLNFKPVNHFKGEVTFRHENGSFKTVWVMPSADDMEERFPGSLDDQGRIIKKDVVSEVLEKVSGKTGRISGFRNKMVPVPPPLGFSLAAMQRDAGRKLNMTGKEVLDALQELYEEKVTSYPRTDSEYLTTAIREDQIDANFAELSKIPELKSLIDGADMSLKSPIWNNSKVDSHYALIPAADFTASKVASLSEKKKQIFLMIARRLIAQFYPPHTYQSLGATVECEGETFKGTGKQVKSQGWKAVYAVSGDDEVGDETDKDENGSFPLMSNGDSVSEAGCRVGSMTTTAPPAYNDSSFMGQGGAMEKAHLFETDPEIRKRLKEAEGLGRPATRAAIVETLLKRGFIRRKGKTGLESTELGRSLIGIMPPELVSVGLTAIWESRFDEIEAGKLSLDDFMDELADTLRSMVKKQIEAYPQGVRIKGGKKTVEEKLPGDGDPCPECRKEGREGGVLITRKGKSRNTGKVIIFLGCSNSIKQDDGSYLCNYRKFPAMNPMPDDGKECPKCHKGKLETREWVRDGKKKRALFCNQGRDKCDYVEWDNSDRKPKVEVAKMPDDGKECPKCHKGTLVTRGWIRDGKKKRALFCNQGREKCDYVEWDNSDRKPKKK